MYLGFVRHELAHDAAEAKSVFAQRRPEPVITRGRRVAFVEDEVDHFEDRRQARREIDPSRNFEWNMHLGERSFRTNDALRDSRFRREKRTCDFVRRQAA